MGVTKDPCIKFSIFPFLIFQKYLFSSLNHFHIWEVNTGSGNGLVPSGNKPLPEPTISHMSPYGLKRHSELIMEYPVVSWRFAKYIWYPAKNINQMSKSIVCFLKFLRRTLSMIRGVERRQAMLQLHLSDQRFYCQLECGTWYHHPQRLQCVWSRNLRIFKVATWHYRCRHNLKNDCIWDNLQCCLLVPRSPSKPVMLTFDLQSRKV